MAHFKQSKNRVINKKLIEPHFKTIFDSIADGVFTVNSDFIITSFNRAAEKITGLSREETLGRKCSSVLKANICETGCVLAQTLSSGEQIINKRVSIVNSRGDIIPISISTALLKDENKNIIGGVETFRDLSYIEQLQKKISGKYNFADIISRNSVMQSIFDTITQVADTNATILIEGESGTGKELVARAIHNESSRKDFPFIAVNCGAIPETLLESELFGYKAGAFTDAKKDKQGRFGLAQKGSLFLDEIGEISPNIQVKLLRVLQNKTFEPLGGTVEEKADVRIIVATNKNLQSLVKEEKFREDLFYRLNIIRINIPPLRNRKEDIPILLDHFLELKNNEYGKSIGGFTNNAMQKLLDYEYPGNVRELENIIERGVILCNNHYINVSELPEELHPDDKPGIDQSFFSAATLEEIEKKVIEMSLLRNNNNKTKAAVELGIDRSTLRRKIARYSME